MSWKVYYTLAPDNSAQSSARMDSDRKVALTIVVAIVMILVTLSLTLVYLTQDKGMTHDSCLGSIGIMVAGGHNQTTGDDIRTVTVASVRPWCFSNRLEDVIVEIRAPDDAILENRTIQQIAVVGSSYVTYHDVTSPTTTLDARDYFEIPVSVSPPGTRFVLREMSSGSNLIWTTFS